MKKTNVLVLTASIALLSACEKSESSLTPSELYSINAGITISNAWTVDGNQETRAATGNPLFMVYIFDPNSQALTNKGGYMTKLSQGVNFDAINTTGTYTFYGITNLVSGEYTSTGSDVTLTPGSTFTLGTETAPRDICLGSQTVTVTAGTSSYSTSITANHIMSQLALTVKSVPTDVTSMTVTLPSQANVFDFNGTFTGNATSQTLTLTKADAANADGSFDWTCPATIVYPCADGTTEMPIKITWSSATVTDKVVNTTSGTCCLSGKNLSLSTTWGESFRNSVGITAASWAVVEQGTFSWN